MSTLDDLNRRLAEVQDQLLTLSDTDFAEKYRLQRIRDELRDAAAQHREDHDRRRPTEELLAELAARRTQLAAIDDDRVKFASLGGGTAGDAGGSFDFGKLATINNDMAEAQGAPGIHLRISVLKSLLDERGVEYPAE